MAPEQQQQEKKTMGRRSWLDLVLAAGAAAWSLGAAIPAIMYLWPARASGPSETMVSAGDENALPVGQAKMVQSRGRPIIVIRQSQERFRAFSAICTHLGCVVQWDAAGKVIACPCHAAVFSVDGKIISGPPPRPLAEYPVMLIDGEIRVKAG